jgi:hypothetical protein
MTTLCSLDDVKSLMQSGANWTADDPMIAASIEQSSALIRRYTRREFDRQTYVEYFDTQDIDVAIGRGGNVAKFFLKERPVSLVEGDYPILKFHTGGDWANATALDTSYYQFDNRLNAIVIYPQVMQSVGRSLQITYVAGYEEIMAEVVTDPPTDPPEYEATGVLNVPSHIKTACAQQAMAEFRALLNEVTGSSRNEQEERNTRDSIGPSGLCKSALALIRTEVRLMTG